MSADQVVLAVFLCLFVIHFALELWLSVLNARYVQAHRERVPEALKDAISLEVHQRSAEYTLAKTRLGHVSAVFDAGLTLFFLFSGFLVWLNQWAGKFASGKLTQGMVLLLAFSFVNSILNLPLEYYRTFALEARFGFNKTTPRTFWMDRLKGLLLGAVLGVPFVYALLAVVLHSGPLWWLWAALFVIAFQFAMMILYPLMIAPLFNKFTPLEDGALKEALETLAQKCGFAARGIFVMDGSKRSAHSNAYFTGMGKARRIVLFDTLIQQMNSGELSAVLAHEIGHYKKRHIPKMLLLSCLGILAGFFLLSLLIDWPPLYRVFGIAAPNVPLGLLLISLLAGTFTFWAGPLFHALSRKYEYEADAYAFDQSGGAAPLESALLKLFEKNLATLTPHPAYSTYHCSHPTLLERIQALRRRPQP